MADSNRNRPCAVGFGLEDSEPSAVVPLLLPRRQSIIFQEMYPCKCFTGVPDAEPTDKTVPLPSTAGNNGAHDQATTYHAGHGELSSPLLSPNTRNHTSEVNFCPCAAAPACSCSSHLAPLVLVGCLRPSRASLRLSACTFRPCSSIHQHRSRLCRDWWFIVSESFWEGLICVTGSPGVYSLSSQLDAEMGPLGTGRVLCLLCPKPCVFRKAADVLRDFRALKTSNLHLMALAEVLPPEEQLHEAADEREPTEPSCCPEPLPKMEKQCGG